MLFVSKAVVIKFYPTTGTNRNVQQPTNDMQDSESTMGAEEYDKFTTQGSFTIRRTFKFWSGTWRDITIEQSLMKNMKTFGASLMTVVSVIVYCLDGRRECQRFYIFVMELKNSVVLIWPGLINILKSVTQEFRKIIMIARTW
ncbi:hypothetical protein AVEN_141930-1 [Araneus ventricosus]|uniref:Uncharacterized protein n=1 Tax=Araneus ventricosus TaxID=182803 RepID=A0A4Y2K7S0_ARAVE|nr:hypothetical protein AVEN_141930-1 [Araneus ventricosus]